MAHICLCSARAGFVSSDGDSKPLQLKRIMLVLLCHDMSPQRPGLCSFAIRLVPHVCLLNAFLAVSVRLWV